MRPLTLLITMGIFSTLFGCKKGTNIAASKPDPSRYQFEQPENTACFSCRHVIKGSAPILHVTHDADDGGWQFLCGGDHTEDDAMIVGMGDLLPENWSELEVRFPVRLATTEPRNETQEIQSGTDHRDPQGG